MAMREAHQPDKNLRTERSNESWGAPLGPQISVADDTDFVSLGAAAANVVRGLMLRRAGELRRRPMGEEAKGRRLIATGESVGGNLD
ncbi:hypothetical protein [Kaistia granuli]|uniref:hypothetical protein n=1 Tax=Kaistia granuli TaxID=363259 RepID=UPI0003725A5C|nr:hypothetical protein [Kaistia granuli]